MAQELFVAAIMGVRESAQRPTTLREASAQLDSKRVFQITHLAS